MKRRMIRQGDVLLAQRPCNPSKKAKAVSDRGRTVLAYGEVTGHAHEVVTGTGAGRDDVPAMQLFEEPGGLRLLVVRSPATLRHEEHGPIELAPDNYEVIRQREYSPGAIRNVAD